MYNNKSIPFVSLLTGLQFPQSLKTKAVYFVKKMDNPVKSESFHSAILYGEMANLPLDQLQALVDTVSIHVYAIDIAATLLLYVRMLY